MKKIYFPVLRNFTAIFLVFALANAAIGQSTKDTLYPGVDLQILSLESLKKEVIQGEGIAVQMTVMNKGIATSEKSFIDFWISDNDEAELSADDVNTTKELLPLKQDTKVDFSHLVVIPEEYKGKFVYITAVIRKNNKNGNDPTPDNNTRFLGVKLGDPNTYKDGMYTYDGAIKSFELIKAPKKIIRNKAVSSKTVFTITGSKAPKAGQTIDIILSKDKTLDAGDAIVQTFPVPNAKNAEPTEIMKDLIFGKHYAKGKAYIFAVIRPGKWNDPESGNNASEPVKIKLK